MGTRVRTSSLFAQILECTLGNLITGEPVGICARAEAVCIQDSRMLTYRMVMISQSSYTLAKRIEDLQNYMTGTPYLITNDRSVRERVRVIAEKIRFSVFRCLFATGG